MMPAGERSESRGGEDRRSDKDRRQQQGPRNVERQDDPKISFDSTRLKRWCQLACTEPTTNCIARAVNGYRRDSFGPNIGSAAIQRIGER